MPVRATPAKPEDGPVAKVTKKVETPPATVNSSPLKLAVHAFLNKVGLMENVTEQKERMSKVDGDSIPTLFVVFDSDANAHLCALRYLQHGDDFGGAKNELICNGFPRTDEDEDDLILVFQTLPRGDFDYSVDEKLDPIPRVGAFLKTTKVKHKMTHIPGVAGGAPRMAGVEFNSIEECAEVAFAYIATDSTDETAMFVCEADPDTDDFLGFFAI